MSGGARKNAPAESDDLEEAFFTAVVDLVICLRGKTPNADLGMTDEFLYVGEWGLARDELMALIDEGNVRLDDRAKESLARLRAVEQRIADETVK